MSRRVLRSALRSALWVFGYRIFRAVLRSLFR